MKSRAPGPLERVVLAYLVAGPRTAGEIGGHAWRGKPRGKIISSNGGGDYGAQMLLGRMRRQGWVRAGGVATSEWELTAAGHKALREIEGRR